MNKKVVTKMKILICIDDTDNLETVGTGHHAQSLKERMEEKGYGKTDFISRHQLFVHPDVPYTSHNSAMCFGAEIEESDLEAIIELSKNHLIEVSADGSDPGLAVAVVDKIANIVKLIAFGKSAKCAILTKEMAYELALQMNIHLSEHGGTGQGIIGALAGIALRLYGSDGRIKGKCNVASGGDTISAAELLRITGFDGVVTTSGKKVEPQAEIHMTDPMIKAVYLDWQQTILVEETSDIYQLRTLYKDEYKCY